MQKTYTLAILMVAFLQLSAFSQQQYPERKPYFKAKNLTVANRLVSNVTVDSITPADLVNELLGPGAVISNLTYTGSLQALGSFIDAGNSFGIDSGVVISTGNVMYIPGPNVSPSSTTVFNTPGDSLLNTYTNWGTYDAAIIEFDMTVLTDTIGCTFVFASEEYPEWANSNFNDLFAFFVSGPGITSPVNIALLPGTNTPVSINNVNDSVNPQYYVDNTAGTELEFDGYTIPIQCQYPIQNGQTYHFKIAIADCADANFDSGIFLKKNSILGLAAMPVPNFSAAVSGLTVQLTNTTNYALFYVWDFGDGFIDTTTSVTTSHTYAIAGNYTLRLEAHNYYQIASVQQTLNMGGVGIFETGTFTAPLMHSLGHGTFTVSTKDLSMKQLKVYTLTGALQYELTTTDTNLSLDLTSLPKGLYLVVLESNQGVYRWKVVR